LPDGAALRFFVGRGAADELVKVAFRAPGGLFLIHEREIAFVEFLEELIPVDRLKLLFGISGKIEPQHTDIASATGALDACGMRAAFLGPLADFVMIAGRMR